MSAPFPGFGTLINIATILIGGGLGMVLGNRLREHTRSVVTDCLGLVTMLMAALSAYQVTDPALEDFVGAGAPVLIILGSLLIGSVTGSLLGIERRLEGLAGRIQRRVSGHGSSGSSGSTHAERERFIEGWMTASLLFCVGPLAILGPLSDGLGRGIDQLVLKSVLDGFAALAFASTFGVGVLMSAASVAVVQGVLTVLGMALGSVLPEAHIAALTATGGLLLIGISLRLLQIREIPVGDMLPALAVAPLLTAAVGAFAG
ncbi:DUF554 domain-containing protein [Demetria terragena]|uniref:DUF554 domain-containing protein n=1 Tax=Demetria terragena TaxID=63959 RepID=UPI00038064EE|nr:DUF554 domain-containing protein [Demetria terragena]